MSVAAGIDPDTWNRWHVVARLDEMPADGIRRTRLLGHDITVALAHDGTVEVTRGPGEILPVTLAYGFAWASLGTPSAPLFAIPEYHEADRRNLNGGTFRVKTSAPRAIENFLDMAHFPFVHTGVLGAEPHTEVKDYDVAIAADGTEVIATRCLFYQPLAAASSTGGADVAYRYRVPHPYCAILYKDSPAHPGRMDVITIFIQPAEEEEVIASLFLSLLDDETPDEDIRRFQQHIFAEDKPILENQLPRRLPLAPRAETPIRADKSSIAYRRWLRQQGTSFGVIR